MLYRKAPPNPPRLLLRIVATAGAGALLGMPACGGMTNIEGLTISPTDAGEDGESDAQPIFTGLLANSPDANSSVCGANLVCGSVALLPDGGDAGLDAPEDARAAGDAGDVRDAEGLDAADDVVTCGGVCGVIVHIDP
jgi:hypothetical protein